MSNKVSDHFKESELACSCCGKFILNEELLEVLENVRCHFGVSVYVTSSTRCREHNKAVGGAVASQHLLGTAADIKVKNVLPVEVYTYLAKEYKGKYGLGCYNNFTHVDVRKNKARW